LKKVRNAQELVVPEIGSPQEVILPSFEDLPASSRNAHITPLSIKLNKEEDQSLLTHSTRSKRLDEKFNRAFSELLKDDATNSEEGPITTPKKWPPLDTNKKYNPFSTDSLLNSKRSHLDSSPEKTSEGNSVEVPDYSPDFNSESDMIGNIMLRNGKNESENDVRLVALQTVELRQSFIHCSSPIEELEDEDELNSTGEGLGAEGNCH
jgi:hypothetical protein